MPVTGFDQFEHASLTDVGIRRSHNQDAHALLLASDEANWERHGHIYLVADGMGAHAVGEMASELAAKIILHTYQKHATEGPAAALRKAFVEANASIHARGQQNREFEGMGTTGTALLIRPEGAWIAHVGDSRAYRIRYGCIEQLSFDHSLVWELARRQKVDPDGLQGIPSNVIVRSLGPEPLVQVDVEGPHPLQPGDIFVLCSDGLSGPVSDLEIGAVASTLPLAEACQFLIDLANLRGGPDNITVMIVRVGGDLSLAGAASKGKGFWPRNFPWPILALFMGVFLAGGAVAALFAGLSVLGVLVAVLATAALVAGLVGLWRYQQREQKRLATQTHRPRLKTYRQTNCSVERPLLDKIARAAAALAERARDRHWNPDWPVHDHHQHLAKQSLGRGDLPGTFREYCRAVRTLTEALIRQRNKEEVFQPVWDKTESV
jgi:protein phosphatase